MKAKKNVLEWIVFGVGAALVATLVIVLAHGAVTRRSSPPNLAIELGRATPASGGHTVPVTVLNTGGTTAGEVRVEVRLERDGTEVEKSELTLRFAPSKSRREGWVVFQHDPSCCRMTARPLGFERP